jgi:hypothetical protein
VGVPTGVASGIIQSFSAILKRVCGVSREVEVSWSLMMGRGGVLWLYNWYEWLLDD